MQLINFLQAFVLCSIINSSVSDDLTDAPHDITCDGQPDGLHEIGCWGYANCVNGLPEIHACPAGYVLERDTMTCVKPGEGHTDCYLPPDCTGKADGSYPDLGDQCQTYYRCAGGANLGRFYCPASLVFNEALQICDYPHNIPPPCGTAGATPKPAAPVIG